MTRRVALLLLAAALATLLSLPARAHEFQPSVLDVRALGQGRYEVVFRAAPGGSASPVLPPDCQREGDAPEITAGLPARWTIACGPEGLAGRTLSVKGLAFGRADALVRFTGEDGAEVSAILRAQNPSLTLPARATPRRAVAGTYFGAGVEHLLTGWDHLLFVLGLLLLVKRPRALLGTITAFTAAHSLSLALAVTGVVQVPPAPAEAAIALSLLFLAGELSRVPERPTLARRHPWVMAFTFGLIHGLGFAGGLSALGLPAGRIPLALLMFNLGIEAGQIAFVIAVLALARLAGRFRLPASRLPVYVLGSLAGFLCIDRIAQLFPQE